MAGGGGFRSKLRKVVLEGGNQGFYRKSKPARKVEVLINASPKEVKSWAGRDITDMRMMFDVDGNVYVWDGMESIHNPIIEGLELSHRDIVDSMSDTPVHPNNYEYWIKDHNEDVSTYNHMEEYAPAKVEVDPEIIDFDEDTLSSPDMDFGMGGAVKAALTKRWRIWDTKAKEYVGQPYKNKNRARTRMDKLDNEYGAYRYQVREVESKAGGGGIKKFTRRDVLKGLGAGATTAIATGKMGTKQAGSRLEEIQGALAAAKKVDLAPRDLSKPFAKDVFSTKEWNVVGEYLESWANDFRRDIDAIHGANVDTGKELARSEVKMVEIIEEILEKPMDEPLTARQHDYFQEFIEDATDYPMGRSNKELRYAPESEHHELFKLFQEESDILDNIHRESATPLGTQRQWREMAHEAVPDATPQAKEAFEEILQDGRIWDDRLEYSADDFEFWVGEDVPDGMVAKLTAQERQQIYDMIHSGDKGFGWENETQFMERLKNERLKKAGGGKIRKFSRRDVLKGLGAAGTAAGAGALGAGKAAVKKGSLEEIEKALDIGGATRPFAPPAWSKQDMTPRQWNTIQKYMADKLDDLYKEYAVFHDAKGGDRPRTQQELFDMRELEAEINELEFIESAEPDYVFDPSSQETLEEFIEETVHDLGIEIHDYGDWDDINDPRVTHVREMERLLSPQREWKGDVTVQEQLFQDLGEPGAREKAGLGPRARGKAGDEEKFTGSWEDDEFAGGGAIRKGLNKLKGGPGLHEAAKEAIRKGDLEEGLRLLNELQELLQLSDEDFSQMIGSEMGRPRPKTEFIASPNDLVASGSRHPMERPRIPEKNPLRLEELLSEQETLPSLSEVREQMYKDMENMIERRERQLEEYGGSERRSADSPLRKAGGGPIKGGLIQAQEAFARRAGKRFNPGLDIPQGFDSFYTKNEGRHTAIIGVRADGTEQNVGNITSLHPGDDTEKLAKELAGAYNTGGFSTQAINPVPLEEIFGGIGKSEPDVAEIIDITGGGTSYPDPDAIGVVEHNLPGGDRLRSFQDHLRNIMRSGDSGDGYEGELADLATIAEDSLGGEDYERLMDDLYEAGLTPSFYREFAENVKKGQPFFKADVTLPGGPIKMAEILEGLGISPDELGDTGVRQRLTELLGEAEGLEETAAFDPAGKTVRNVETGEVSRTVDLRRLTYEELSTLQDRKVVSQELSEELMANMVDLEAEFQDIIYDMTGDWPDELRIMPDLKNPEHYIMESHSLDTDTRRYHAFDPESGPREATRAEIDSFNTNRPEALEPIGPKKPEFAEGGEVEDLSELRRIATAEKGSAREFMQNVGASLLGAIPFAGDTGAEVGVDVGDRLFQLGAAPVAGFKSQWWGTNPTTGEFEYAGPGGEAFRNPHPNAAVAIHDPEEYERQLEAFNERLGQTHAIPGIIDETALLPAMPQMIEMMTDMDEMEADPYGYEPFIGAPDFSLHAAERAEENWNKSIASMGMDEPKGFVENTLMSLGMMAGQLPIPVAALGRVKSLARLLMPKGARAAHILDDLIKEAHPNGRLRRTLEGVGGAAPEFLFPTIEPKVSNYIAGSLFGGTLLTALSPDEQEEIPTGYRELISIMQDENEPIEDRQLAKDQLTKILEAEAIKEEKEKQRLESNERSLEQMGKSGAFAGGGGVKKFTRRDILKGLGAAGTAAVAAGKAGTRSAEPGAALKEIEAALDVAPVAAKQMIPPNIAAGAPWRKVLELIEIERGEWDMTRDIDMKEMYDQDSADYEKIARYMEEGRVEEAATVYDSMDTSAREMIYDLDDDLNMNAKRNLGKGFSDVESLEWEDIDIGEQEMIIDELQSAYETGGQKSYEEVADSIREQYGISVDVMELEHHIFEGGFAGPNDFAGGGKIRKGLTRRDVLKGAGAAGVAGAAGALGLGKAATKVGVDPSAALPAVKEALTQAIPEPLSVFRMSDLSRKMQQLLVKEAESYMIDVGEVAPPDMDVPTRARQYAAGEVLELDDMNFHENTWDPDSQQKLDEVLEHAIERPGQTKVDELKELRLKIRLGKDMTPNEFFKAHRESASDRPSAFYDYAERMGIKDPPELNMRELQPEDYTYLEKIFPDGIPEELINNIWDT